MAINALNAIALPGPAYSVIILIATFVTVILLDVFGQRKHVQGAAIAGLALSLLPLLLPLGAPFSSLVKVDLFSVLFAALFIAIAIITLLASHEATAVYNGSILLSTVGMVLAAASNDLLLLYISIELVTSPTYALVAYHKTRQRMEAATKYFIVGIVASALLLLGIGLITISAGTTTISSIDFGTSAASGPWFLLGIAALIAGLGFKLSMFPFNLWVPDVYQGAPPEVSGFLAGATKKAAYAALLRVAVVIAVLHSWTTLFAVLAALTMTIANIIALLQNNLRRMLAYSIMSQAGFLLLGIAVATQLGYAATMLHVFAHAFMAAGAFIVLGVFAVHKVESVDDIKGLGWKNPLLGISLTVFLLSLAGIPFLSGFVSKFVLVYATVDGGLLWLAVLAVLNSALALYYYFRVIRAMYAYPGGGTPYALRTGTIVAIIICLTVTVLVGIWPQPFLALAVKASGTLF